MSSAQDVSDFLELSLFSSLSLSSKVVSNLVWYLKSAQMSLPTPKLMDPAGNTIHGALAATIAVVPSSWDGTVLESLRFKSFNV